jgi:hypothetical protein
MKNEFPDDVPTAFYGTGAKAYYVKSLLAEMKKAKGVKKSVIAKHLHLEDYKNIVEQGGLIFRKMKSFKSELHDVYTEIKNKVALSHSDDKRYIIPGSVKTLPWGHSDISFYKTPPEDNLKFVANMIDDILKNENIELENA